MECAALLFLSLAAKTGTRTNARRDATRRDRNVRQEEEAARVAPRCVASRGGGDSESSVREVVRVVDETSGDERSGEERSGEETRRDRVAPPRDALAVADLNCSDNADKSCCRCSAV